MLSNGNGWLLVFIYNLIRICLLKEFRSLSACKISIKESHCWISKIIVSLCFWGWTGSSSFPIFFGKSSLSVLIKCMFIKNRVYWVLHRWDLLIGKRHAFQFAHQMSHRLSWRFCKTYFTSQYSLIKPACYFLGYHHMRIKIQQNFMFRSRKIWWREKICQHNDFRGQ